MRTVLALSLVCYALGQQVFPVRVCQDLGCWNLRHVSAVFRHTARSPALYPQNDPFLNPKLYPRGMGKSTILGLQQAHVIGRLWKTWWMPTFLSGDPNEAYARASAYPRCYETTEAILFELYSPGPCSDARHFCLPYDPVPITSPPMGHDKNIDFCIPDMSFNSTEIASVQVPRSLGSQFRTLEEFILYAKNRTGHHNLDTASFFSAVIDAYISNRWNNLPVPPWIDQIWPVWSWASNEMYGMLARSFRPFAGHNVMNDVAKTLQEASNPTKPGDPTKLSLFGYHDVTVSSLWFALNPDLETTRGQPDYMGGVFFELYEHSSKPGLYAVRTRISQGLKVDGKYSYLEVITPRGCESEMCPLDDLVNLLKTNYAAEADYSVCPNNVIV